MGPILAVLRLLVVIAFYDGTVTAPMNTSELAILTDTMLIAGLSEEKRLYVAKAAPYHS